MTAFIENFLFYLIFAPACASVLNKIMYMSNYKMQAMESMRRIDTILLAREQSEAQEPQMAQGSDICFEHVTFTYPTGEQPAVSDVSFTAKAGTVTALVGHSGSGKTTIGTLVPRFYDVQEGRITLGGVELSEISRQEVMGKIAFVFQNPKLLKTTLEENIRGGCKNASGKISCGQPVWHSVMIFWQSCRRALTASWAGKASIFPEEKYSGWLLPGQF